MFALNWPVEMPAALQLGCDEDYWTLYMFTSPVDDWSYYEERGLEVTEQMEANAVVLQSQLKEINHNLSHPTEWVSVVDDTKGNSDHYNFIMNGHSATWLRGQHQYILEEGDSCEQTPKHAQTDSVTTLNTMAGGRTNVESGLQTGMDIIATMALWDRNSTADSSDEVVIAQASQGVNSAIASIAMLIVTTIFCMVIYRQEKEIFSENET
jgi:Zn-dependent M28 family amino/carboxypeptidase